MNRLSKFAFRDAVIATKHGKEGVIGPLLHEYLGITAVVPSEIDTDQFGTFTRDMRRQGTMLDAALAKVEEGMRLTGADLGVASEGSFGPHPAVPFVPVNTELVLLFDKKQDIRIVGHSLSLKTNYNQRYVGTFAEAQEFAELVGFPQHGLVVRCGEDSPANMIKGVTDPAELLLHVEAILANSRSGKVFLETDMRAHVNPTRMENIKLAAEDLVRNCLRLCPSCETPGFRIMDRRRGLPCEVCGTKTEEVVADVYSCDKCHLTKEELYPSGLVLSPAEHCGYCNP